ncbi:DUF2058 domain-containing protein [Alteromonas sp. ASW11-36]|uniref:DUF2058 domain-containing protein n=1 Tax=Alteromonas arenosi TaxID=3055817 RepID=A0ABT7SXX6_9ALTE|nr:DUF2058 domain-containing protein [Alteromonas sp. ASW11-36]MDM7861038.1 DUF2058 domain-containing protein [Alteromonas sp. ASW11-36]
MALSLQEQLLKAGVADKSKAKQARAEKRKQKKRKQPVDNAAQAAAQEALAAKKVKDRELNQQQNAVKHERSVAAQVKQLIDLNKQSRSKGETLLNFTHDNKIKRMYVTDAQHKGVLAAKLAVVLLEEEYELVPIVVAEKIAERAPQSVVYIAEIDQAVTDEVTEGTEDWYADYEIPDDLTW